MTKQIFNVFAEVKMPYDKWTIMDILAAGMNLVSFNLIGNISYTQVLDVDAKKTLDYYVIIVILLSWGRFFMYFLVVRPVSKLMMIIIRVCVNITTYIFILMYVVMINLSIF